MITLNDVHNWMPLGLGELIEYPSDRARPVTLELNTSGEAIMMIQFGDSAPQLLALVKGRETLKFAVPGKYAIMHKSPDVDVMVLTADGSKIHREQMGDETFTTLHERAPRDPHLEQMMYTMEMNFQRRMKAQEEQIARTYEAALASAASNPVKDASGGKPDAATSGGQSGGSGGNPDEDEGKAGSNDEKS